MNEIKRIVDPLRKEPALLAASVAVGALAAVFNLARPQLLGRTIGSISAHSSISHLIVLLFFSWIGTWGITVFLRRICALVSQRVLKYLRDEVLAHYLLLPLDQNEQTPKGRIEAYMMSDLPVWCGLYGSVLAEIVHSTAQLILSLVTLSKMDVRLTLFIVPFLVLSAIVPFTTAPLAQKVSRRAQDSNSDLFERISGVIRGVRDIAGNQAYRWAMERCSQASGAFCLSEVRRVSVKSALNVLSSSFEILAYILVLGIGSRYVETKQMEIGELIAYLATIEMLFFPARYSSELVGSIQDSLASAKRVWEFLDEGTPQQISSSQGLKLERVSFMYPGASKYALKDITCIIEPGELVAVVGESGSGKSTFLNLLAGIYRPTAGTVIPVGSRDARISCVWQEVNLFHGTVAANLAMGDYRIDPRYIDDLNLDTVIKGMGGFQGEIRDNGLNLSGGERQRLALVRALTREPDLLILDEPSSSLDSENEKQMWELLGGLRITRVVSTHRLDHVEAADKILVFSKGELAEAGTHEQLVSMGGIYADLIKSHLK